MQVIGVIFYFGLGIVQLAAVIAGLESWWGLNGFFSFIVAFIVTYIPLLGSIVGVAGAMKAWHWEWWQAGGLFFGGLLITALIVCGAGFVDRFRR